MQDLRIWLGTLIFAAAWSTAYAAVPLCGDIRERCEDEDLARRIAALLPPTEFAFVSTGQPHFTRAFNVAAAEMVWQHARGAATLSAGERGTVAAELIGAYLLVGLDGEAIKLYESLDAPVRERATTGAIVYALLDEGPWDGFEVAMSPQLTAAGLAMAYADAGALDRAEPLLRLASQPVQPGVEDSYDGDLVAPSKEAAACVRELIQPAAAHDWFAWRFHNESGARNDPGCPRALHARTYQRAAARAMAGSNLPEGWRLGVEPNDNPNISDSGQDDLDAALKKLPAVQARVAALKSDLDAIDRRDEKLIEIGKGLERTAEKLFAEPKQGDPSDTDKQLAHTLAERLAKPIYNPYKVAAPDAKAHASSAPCASKPDYAILSCFESAHTRWELSTSTDYSPTGEVPAAGFWLRRVDVDAGTAKNYYLGIREHLPFELVTADAPPLIESDRMHLRVRQAKIDTRRLTFPPLGLQVKREDSVSDLSADLKDIMRDTDGDGLTDLAEQQLLLDPEKTDSDGDGIPDADDPLPNVARGQARSPDRQAAMAAAIAHLSHAEDPGISFLVPGSGTFDRRRSGSEKTLFIVADPEDFTSLSSDSRVIILPRSLDWSLLGKNPLFSVFLPMRVSIEMLGDGRHAEVTFSAGWAGGRLALERGADGAWHVGVLDDWVT